MTNEWTILYLSGASLQIVLENHDELSDDELYDSLCIKHPNHGYPDIAIPGFPVRYSKDEWLFPDGVVKFLPKNTWLVTPGYTHYKNLILEDGLVPRVILFEEVE